jgi:predicted ATP-binding protein involved in virulence
VSEPVRITRFEITGLFGRPLNHTIDFPEATTKGEPSLLILAGPNGCGKTFILRAIEGLLDLDFDLFRRIPFTNATLSLSNGNTLRVERRDDKSFPLLATFQDVSAVLAEQKEGQYTKEQSAKVQAFRDLANRYVTTIRYELLDIHRSVALNLVCRGTW